MMLRAPRNRLARATWSAFVTLALAVPACGDDDSAADVPTDDGVDHAGDVVADAADDAAPDVEPDGSGDVGFDTDDAGDSTDVPGGCPRPGDPGPGTHTLSMEFDGLSRSYLLFVPSGYDSAASTPLVLNLHGYSSNGGQQVYFSNMNETAEARGFVVAYPNGVENSWNGGLCCGEAAADDVDDVGFLSALVDELARNLCIDRARVFAAGMSNGGYMSYRLACEAPGVFAGFAPVAGGIGIPDCAPARPRPLLAFHGTEDSYVPYAFGEASFHDYAAVAGCTGDPVRTAYGDSHCDVYESCDDGVRVGLCTLVGMDHCWPGGEPPRRLCETFVGAYSTDLNANEVLWDFLDP